MKHHGFTRDAARAWRVLMLPAAAPQAHVPAAAAQVHGDGQEGQLHPADGHRSYG